MYWHCPTLFTTESGLPYNEPRFGLLRKAYEFLGVDEDPVFRWHHIAMTYSGLKLTYASDRLPAIAAVVEREMRLRQGDIYIAGIWKSSLLTDLVWSADYTINYPALPRLPTSNPTWSWPSSQARIVWSSGSIVPSLRLLDLSFTRVGPAHIGEVADASITLEGHTCKTRLKHISDPEVRYHSSMEMVPPPCQSAGVRMPCSMDMDFDWTTGDRPVMSGATFTSMLMKICPDHGHCTGLVLREMPDGSFERMGTIEIRAEYRGRASKEELFKVLSNFVEAMPIRQVKII